MVEYCLEKYYSLTIKLSAECILLKQQLSTFYNEHSENCLHSWKHKYSG